MSSFDFVPGRINGPLEIIVRKDALVRVDGLAAGLEAELVHVRRRLLRR